MFLRSFGTIKKKKLNLNQMFSLDIYILKDMKRSALLVSLEVHLLF